MAMAQFENMLAPGAGGGRLGVLLEAEQWPIPAEPLIFWFAETFSVNEINQLASTTATVV